MTSKSHEFWTLSTATKYEDTRRGQPRPKSRHSFGWNARLQQFELHNEHGLGMSTSLYLPMPTELAEMFLLKCLQDQEFNNLFFIDFYPSQLATDVIEIDGATLFLTRGRAQLLGGGRDIVPGLTLEVERGGKKERVHLSFELRSGLGKYLRTLTPGEIHHRLTLPLAA